jgi:hypothetical protein
VVLVIEGQENLGHAEGLAQPRAVEKHVLHLGVAQHARALLAQNPADGIDDVGLAAAVGADNGGDAAGEIELQAGHEGFESRYFELPQLQGGPSPMQETWRRHAMF